MTLDDLRAPARSKTDEDSVGYIDNTQLDRFINQGYRFLYTKIAQKFEDYFIVEGTTGNTGKFETVSGTAGYNLPTGMKKLVKVEVRSTSSTSDDDYRRVDKVNISTDAPSIWTSNWDLIFSSFRYFMAGNKIYFKPVPTQAYTVRLWFVPKLTKLTLTTDEPVIDEDYHELIAGYAAIQCLGKSGEPIFTERMELFKLELDNMLETVEVRDQQPEVMAITEDSQVEDPRRLTISQ